MSSKVKSMSEAVRLVQDGQLLAVGGNALHRTPAAFCHELAKLGRKGLKDCGAAAGYALDVRLQTANS
jgi:glutaconate CoA-transferase subunit A